MSSKTKSKIDSPTESPTEELKANLLKELKLFFNSYGKIGNFKAFEDKIRECLLNGVKLPLYVLHKIIYLKKGHRQNLNDDLANQLLETYSNNELMNENIALNFPKSYQVYLKKFNTKELNTYINKLIHLYQSNIRYDKEFQNFIINIQKTYEVNNKIELLLIDLNMEHLIKKDKLKVINIYKQKTNGGIKGIENFLKKNLKFHIGETELNYALSNQDIDLFNLCLDYKIKLTKESIKLLFVKVKPYYNNNTEKYVFLLSNQYFNYNFRYAKNNNYSINKINAEKIILEYTKLDIQFLQDDIELFLKNGIVLNPSKLKVDRNKEIINLYCKYNNYSVFSDTPEPSQEGLDHLASFVTAKGTVNKVCKKYNMKPTTQALRLMCSRSNTVRSFKDAAENLVKKYDIFPDQDCLQSIIVRQGKPALNLIFDKYVKGQKLMRNKIKQLETELIKYKTGEVIPKTEKKEEIVDKKVEKKEDKKHKINFVKMVKKVKYIEDEIYDINTDEEDDTITYKQNEIVKIPLKVAKMLFNKTVTEIKYSNLKDKFIRYIFEKDLMDENENIILDKKLMKFLSKERIKTNSVLKESEIDTFLSKIILKK